MFAFCTGKGDRFPPISIVYTSLPVASSLSTISLKVLMPEMARFAKDGIGFFVSLHVRFQIVATMTLT
ncbi:MAG: hypothetical protein F6K17_17775 [Okeania sp. SIO3C4]|nr:hypothetical protein [Okeania sp. SIO3C4]